MSPGDRGGYERTFRSSSRSTVLRDEQRAAVRESERRQEELRNASTEQERLEKQAESDRAAERARQLKQEQERAEADRRKNLRESEARTRGEEARSRAKAAEQSQARIDPNLARNTIGLPPKAAKRIYVMVVDDSGSNQAIAKAIKNGAGYIHAALGVLSEDSAIAFLFFSDHFDGANMLQEVDYTMGPDGDAVLRASMDNINDADGDDLPEAIECALAKINELDFGHIPKKHRHLILVTDVVAHGMGMSAFTRDSGCPHQVQWQDVLREVHQNFASFKVVATGNDSRVLKLQEKFIVPERLRFDLMDMVSGGLSHEERCRLVNNAVLCQIFVTLSPQAAESFFSGLYMKWLAEPQYGSATAERARAQITAFASYLEISDDERKSMLERVFGD